MALLVQCTVLRVQQILTYEYATVSTQQQQLRVTCLRFAKAFLGGFLDPFAEMHAAVRQLHVLRTTRAHMLEPAPTEADAEGTVPGSSSSSKYSASRRAAGERVEPNMVIMIFFSEKNMGFVALLIFFLRTNNQLVIYQ